MFTIRLVLISLLLASTGYAQIPTQESTTVKTVPGKLVKLEAIESSVMAEWILADGPDDLYAVSETGRMCYFASPNTGRFIFILAYLTPDQYIKIHKYIVQVDSDNDNNNNDDDDKNNKIPDGRFKLAKISYDSCKSLTPEYKDTISKVAKNYRTIKAQAENNIFNDAQTMLNATKIGNQQVCAGVDRKKVEQIFSPHVTALQNLKLTSIEDLIIAWDEIATGFEAWVKE